jgi:2-haloacid dehalogenase
MTDSRGRRRRRRDRGARRARRTGGPTRDAGQDPQPCVTRHPTDDSAIGGRTGWCGPAVVDDVRVIDGLLLDFYGTIVDEDDAVVERICRQVAASAGDGVTADQVGSAWWREFRAGMVDDIFRPQRELAVASLATVIARFSADDDPVDLAGEQFAFWRQPPLRPGARDFLAGVDLPVCIVSNIDRDDLQAALAHHGLTFTTAVTSQDVRSYKPRPEIFHRAMALLGLPADRVVHAGDSWTADVLGATAVGIPTVWIRRQRPLPAANAPAPPLVIDELADLHPHLVHRHDP